MLQASGLEKSESVKNILILCGGGGSEHEVSLRSAAFFRDLIRSNPKRWENFVLHSIVLEKDGTQLYDGEVLCEISTDRSIRFQSDTAAIPIDFVLPVLHGVPGESGEVPGMLEFLCLPFLGVKHEASALCFNKVSTKLWLQTMDIPIVPYIYLADASANCMERAREFFKRHNGAYVKASHQGSSVGCFLVEDISELPKAIHAALELSPYVLIEQPIVGRELEVAVYEYQGQVCASQPGEILSPGGFYTYEEKYNSTSSTHIQVIAQNLTAANSQAIQSYAKQAFTQLGLRHLARVDFFLSQEGEVFLNEINTFPGHTEISMFPLMLAANGHNYSEYLRSIVDNELA